MKRIALLAPLLLVLASCGGNAPAGKRNPSAAEAQLPAAPEPNPGGTPDPAIVKKLIDAGAEPDEARVLALTTWNASSPEPGVAHVVLTYPWGDTSRIELRVRRVDASEVKPAEILETSVEPGRVALAIQYYVPEADIPMALASALPPAMRARELDIFGLLIPTAHAQQLSGGFGQVFQRWLTETASDEVRDKLLDKTLGAKLGGRISAQINVANAAKDLSKLSEEALKRIKELDELRKCIESNPRGAQWAPGEKEKVLKQLDETRADIIADDTVRGVNTVTGVVAGILTPVVGLLTGPALEWSKQELEQLVEQRMNQIRRSANNCKKGYVIGGCELQGEIPAVDGPFHARASGVSFRFTPTGEKAGTWDWKHSGAIGEGPYHITLDKDETSGTLTLPPGRNLVAGQSFITQPWSCTLTRIK